MKKITNREEANQYYKKVNELVDEYITKWKVRPSEIFHYFKRNMESFLESSGLSDVEGIKRVVDDVLEHRKHMELDKVMKFESFNKLNEGVINIGNATVEHEKVLADFYNTSLGHIDIIDDDIHLYKVNDFGKKVTAVIFSDGELKKIRENIISQLVEETKKRVLSVSEVDGIEMGFSIRLWISDIFSEDSFRKSIEEKINNEHLLLIIKNIVQRNQDLPVSFSNDRLSYKDSFDGYHIWEIK